MTELPDPSNVETRGSLTLPSLDFGLWRRASAFRIADPRGKAAFILELSGLAAIVAGISLVYVPAALVVGGILAVLAALALERA